MSDEQEQPKNSEPDNGDNEKDEENGPDENEQESVQPQTQPSKPGHTSAGYTPNQQLSIFTNMRFSLYRISPTGQIIDTLDSNPPNRIMGLSPNELVHLSPAEVEALKKAQAGQTEEEPAPVEE